MDSRSDNRHRHVASWSHQNHQPEHLRSATSREDIADSCTSDRRIRQGTFTISIASLVLKCIKVKQVSSVAVSQGADPEGEEEEPAEPETKG